ATGEPGLGVAGLADIDAVIAGAETIEAPLADDQFAERGTRLVLQRDKGRLALAGVLDLEPGIELGLLRFWLDERQIGHRQRDLPDLADDGGIVALFGGEPALPLAPAGPIQPRRVHPA